ncbi:MAG: hypothetical protein HYU52_02660 [Acidobacteria bacterium]|nr:hypothetical protein [Acidobacteriota bacterium]
MKAVRIVLAVALLIGVALPELSRYRAERGLRRLITAAMVAASGRVPPQTAGALFREVSQRLEELGGAMPGDARPRMFAASAAMLAGNHDRAIELYMAALGHGERGEIDVNLGLAFARLEDSRAEAMFVRAVWLSPALIDSVPETYRGRVRQIIARRSAPGGSFDPPALPVLPIRSASHD